MIYLAKLKGLSTQVILEPGKNNPFDLLFKYELQMQQIENLKLHKKKKLNSSFAQG